MKKGYVVWVSAVPDELDKEFRNVIILKNGGKIKRGDLKNSLIEAVQEWNKKQRQGFQNETH